jgi:hypothetical protein
MTISQLNSKLKKAKDSIENTTLDCIKGAGDDLIARVKIITPVDTGRLQSSWETEVIQQGARQYEMHIYNDARNPDSGKPYAKYVEYGHYSVGGNWVEGKFMLNRTLPDTVDYLKSKIKGEITSQLT